jgi:hypothetical protein
MENPSLSHCLTNDLEENERVGEEEWDASIDVGEI